MDLTTTYMGLALKNPLIVSSSPISAREEKIKKAVDAGAAAVVLPSLFEEQLNNTGEINPYFPMADDYLMSPDAYLELVRRTASHSGVPIIGSLNGVTPDGWTSYAKQIEEAGAQALELNLYHVAANPLVSAQEIEQRYIDTVLAVRNSVQIPVAVKLTPFFSSFGNMARRLDETGINALVLFNRFYQPDFNLVAMEVEPSLSLSAAGDIRLPLRWIAMLYKNVKASLAATSGVQSGVGVIKYLLAGADAVMTASALLQHGPEYIGSILRDLERWMTSNQYESVHELQGLMSQRGVENPEEFERVNYIKVIETYRKKHL
ncbi:dihydroorotate dehydrogenase-like protein [Tichowtungia aerotolerans]|uniref:Dihydroorotate dehydrogenase-like protein n=1 Tax=Tichowtungia aerotolerans TaxID=2697043 RepID=A0A6P1MEB5_9BACT|nr:dihydroorotate dehydrogenase-like protein [Tichowtungia aerotolerans]